MTATPVTGTPAVHVALHGVAKRFPASPGGQAVHALGPIDLAIRQGEFFAVVGPSGCGKSTLLEIIAGLVPATEGGVEFEGRRVEGDVPDGIGVVFQEDACFPWLSVRDNVAFGLRKAALDEEEKKRRVSEAIAMMGLGEFAGSYPAQLSGGMRQRVCIARTLVTKPRLLLLDEPFGALDQQTRLLMGDEVLRLWREIGATVFLITHALDEAAMLADRIAVMSARPGTVIDVVETHWPRERDSRIVEREDFGAVTSRLWKTLREESMKTMGRTATAPMRRATLYQIAVVAGLVALLEALCLGGAIDKITMPPPHRIAVDFVRLMLAGKLYPEIGKSLANVLLAFVLAYVVGIATGTVLHGFRTVRETLDPLFATYYAIPIFAFYPLFILIFGLGDGPQVLIGFLLGVVAVIVTMLNGLDRVPRVLRKTALIGRLGPFETAMHVTLPFCAPYLLTAAKLALAYAFIGVIGSEFIMARSGMGYEIGFAYTNFDNATMYPLIVLILLLSIILNGLLTHWEKLLLARRGQH